MANISAAVKLVPGNDRSDQPIAVLRRIVGDDVNVQRRKDRERPRNQVVNHVGVVGMAAARSPALTSLFTSMSFATGAPCLVITISSPASTFSSNSDKYPFHDRTIVVTHCGRICLGRKKINFSQVFAGQVVGITSIWRLGCSNRSKIRSAQKCYLCSRYNVLPMSPGRTN